MSRKMARPLYVTISGGHFLGVVLGAATVDELADWAKSHGRSIAGIGGLFVGAIVSAVFASGHQDDLPATVLRHMIRPSDPVAEPDLVGFVSRVLKGADGEGPWPYVTPTSRIHSLLKRLTKRTAHELTPRVRIVTANAANRHSLSLRVKTVWDSHGAWSWPVAARVLASMAIPVMFPPAVLGDNRKVHFDGALAVGNTPYSLWNDLDPDGDSTIILRTTRQSALGHTVANPRVRFDEFVQDAFDTAVAALEDYERDRMPERATLVHLPAFGDSANFEMDEASALSLMRGARVRVRQALAEAA